jgi:Carbohydrate-binding module 48 (Isoamylase N-terminal domain)
MAHDDDFDPFIAGIARELRGPVLVDARFDERVMAAIEPKVVPITRARSARAWHRRTFSFTQAAGMAAAAALVGVVGVKAMRGGDAPARVPAVELRPVANVTVDPSATVAQQFILIAPSATSVALVGDFSDWDASRIPMQRVSEDGAWSVTIPLAPGRYEYQFEVNGSQRITDPTRPQVSSEFGSTNSVVTVERPE